MHVPTSAANAGPPAIDEWRNGWPLVLTALVAYGSAAVYSFIIGVFITPLQADFGWSRAEITGGMMISATLTAIGAPFVGRMIDVYGSRRIGIPGMAIYCTAVAMLATTSGAIWNWWALWVLIACGSVFVKPTVWVTAVSRAFVTSRGLAIAVTMTGAGVFASIAPTTATLLIEAVGWRSAYVIIGLGLALLNLPLLFLFFGRQNAATSVAPTSPAAQVAGFAIRRSMLSRRYIQLGVIAFLVTGAIVGIQVHFVPILIDEGLGKLEAAGAAGLIGIGSVVGRIVTGFMLDRFHGSIVGAIAFFLPILASMLLLFFSSGAHQNMLLIGSLSAFVFGTSLGAELDVLAYLTSRYFGMKNYGTLFGTLIALVALAAGAGPTVAGLIYDYTGGYAAFLWLTAGAFVTGIFAVASLGKYPADFDDQEEESLHSPIGG